ncbi:MAG: hypothetical protein Ta2G_05420 [Termitinemataceae bacterium]|nr:MAG: hypothetical protein Ta2G_05420 [Termitinemataceae bacterium]
MRYKKVIIGIAIFLSAQLAVFSADKKPSGYYTGDGGASYGTVKINEIKGERLGESADWVPAFIQRTLITNFNTYSKIVVPATDSETINAAKSEVNLANAISDDGPDAGNIAIANYILGGSITNTGSNYNIHLQITAVDTRAIAASVDYTSLTSKVYDGSAINKLTLELFEKLGITLTPAGKKALTANISEADEQLARADSARARGNKMEEMIYLFNAKSYNSKSGEASSRLTSFSKSSGGGLGSAISSDIEDRRQWNKNLKDFDDFYKQHLPFELFYTPPTEGQTSYLDDGEGNSNEKISLNFTVGLRANKGAVSALQNVIKKIDNELKEKTTEIAGADEKPKKTTKKKKWGFSEWPGSAEVFKGSGSKIYQIKYNIVNELDEVISSDNTTEVSLTAGMLADLDNKILTYCDQSARISISDIDYNKNESKIKNHQLAIRIVEVDGIPAETAGQIGYMRVIPTGKQKMPRLQISQITKKEQALLAEEAKQIRENRAAQNFARYKSKLGDYTALIHIGAMLSYGFGFYTPSDKGILGNNDFELKTRSKDISDTTSFLDSIGGGITVSVDLGYFIHIPFVRSIGFQAEFLYNADAYDIIDTDGQYRGDVFYRSFMIPLLAKLTFLPSDTYLIQFYGGLGINIPFDKLKMNGDTELEADFKTSNSFIVGGSIGFKFVYIDLRYIIDFSPVTYNDTLELSKRNKILLSFAFRVPIKF